MNEYEEKIQSLEQTVTESYSKEHLDDAVEKALETQKLTMVKEKDDAVDATTKEYEEKIQSLNETMNKTVEDLTSESNSKYE
eukprot:5151891-Ditylum_brightwellii.AAC.1